MFEDCKQRSNKHVISMRYEFLKRDTGLDMSNNNNTADVSCSEIIQVRICNHYHHHSPTKNEISAHSF